MIDKEFLDEMISDTIADFLYYDRKEDENLPRGAIEAAVIAGEITVSEIIEMFRRHLEEGLNTF
jgi:hypothetical protein